MEFLIVIVIVLVLFLVIVFYGRKGVPESLAKFVEFLIEEKFVW
ncbi:MAG: hypothetical protein WBJ13_01130 [Sedimentibacter sp.]